MWSTSCYGVHMSHTGDRFRVSVNVPERIWVDLEADAKAEGRTKTEIVMRALERYHSQQHGEDRRTLAAIIANQDELAKQFEDFEPQPGDIHEVSEEVRQLHREFGDPITVWGRSGFRAWPTVIDMFRHVGWVSPVQATVGRPE